MKNRYALGFALGLSLVIAGCSDTPPPAPDTRVADEKAIRDGEVAWNAEFKAKDAAAITARYANDATLMVSGNPAVKGTDAIRSLVKEMLADKNLSLTFAATTVEVAKGGDIAYGQGTYSQTSTNPKTKKPVTEKGTYVTVYKKQADGAWKAIQDINTTDGPAVPVAAAKPAARAAARRKK